jgi:hypothetical protein
MALLLLLLAVFSASSLGAPVVQTSSGPVLGRTVGLVDEWLGVPYAAPPGKNSDDSDVPDFL